MATDDDSRVLICIAVANQPKEETTPGSEVRWCSLCACEVWVSLEGLRFADEHRDTHIQCYECGVGAAATHDRVQARPVPGGSAYADRPVLAMFKRDVKRARGK